MDQQYRMNIQFAENMVNEGKKTLEDVKESYAMYTMDDLMEKAKEMYSFVSEKK
jgi:hypothetical protein